MAGRYADFFSNLNYIRQVIPDMVDKKNAKNLKALLQCLTFIHPVFGKVVDFLIPEENEIERVVEIIEHGFKEVNDNLKKLENELKMQLESLKVSISSTLSTCDFRTKFWCQKCAFVRKRRA
jgi:hypothetical protein